VKFISAAVNFEGINRDFTKTYFNQGNAVPFGTVLTLPATGARNELW
jgi:alcohol dehydrogenase YqhD (iron-dependent ADH family)